MDTDIIEINSTPTQHECLVKLVVTIEYFENAMLEDYKYSKTTDSSSLFQREYNR